MKFHFRAFSLILSILRTTVLSLYTQRNALMYSEILVIDIIEGDILNVCGVKLSQHHNHLVTVFGSCANSEDSIAFA